MRIIVLFLIILGIGTAVVLIPIVAAFEAHVLSVLAQIDNSIIVTPTELKFATVFPQEKLNKVFDISLGQSFSGELDYVVRQKPKCVDSSGNHPQVLEDQNGNFSCPQGSTMMPLLCPYLSKHEQTTDGSSGENDGSGITAFHGLPGPWTASTSIDTQTVGKLSTVSGDLSDTWNIDLRVPCFVGECAQDWPEFVRTESGDPNINPNLYKADSILESKIFGCDLWVEVTNIQ